MPHLTTIIIFSRIWSRSEIQTVIYSPEVGHLVPDGRLFTIHFSLLMTANSWKTKLIEFRKSNSPTHLYSISNLISHVPHTQTLLKKVRIVAQLFQLQHLKPKFTESTKPSYRKVDLLCYWLDPLTTGTFPPTNHCATTGDCHIIPPCGATTEIYFHASRRFKEIIGKTSLARTEEISYETKVYRCESYVHLLEYKEPLCMCIYTEVIHDQAYSFGSHLHAGISATRKLRHPTCVLRISPIFRSPISSFTRTHCVSVDDTVGCAHCHVDVGPPSCLSSTSRFYSGYESRRQHLPRGYRHLRKYIYILLFSPCLKSHAISFVFGCTNSYFTGSTKHSEITGSNSIFISSRNHSQVLLFLWRHADPEITITILCTSAIRCFLPAAQRHARQT
ncbi:hypothetical protein ABKN59_006138 [Abortiporus biennis]